MASSTWSDNQKKRGSPPKNFLFVGWAYPKVIEGKNPTNQVKADIRDKVAYYNDPAIRLSDDNLNAFNGCQGIPLYEEHTVPVQGGVVRHSWIGDDASRPFKIMGRIPITRENSRVIQGIKSGLYKGLSVGYENKLTGGRIVGTKNVTHKIFKEISLVEEPFFKGCNISWSVAASDKATQEDFEFKIEEMSEENRPTEEKTNAAVAQPPAAAEQQNQDAQELLKQADQLKDQLDSESKVRVDMETAMQQMAKELEYHREREKQAADAYRARQEPKFHQYVSELKASKGGELSEKMIEGYRSAWTDPKFRESAEVLEAQLNTMLELKASKKALEDQLKLAAQEKETLQSTVTATSKVLNSTRGKVAEALSKKEDAMVVEEKTSVNASSLDLIMTHDPSADELGFLRPYGYGTASDVQASANNDRFSTLKQIRTSVPRPKEHRLSRDKDGYPNFPNSFRYIDRNNSLFALMCSEPAYRTVDLSGIVKASAGYNNIKRKDADKWEAQNLAYLQQQQMQRDANPDVPLF